MRLFGASILNDDKPALRRESGVWQVYGTPWSGKEALNQNRNAPLRAICFLFQGRKTLYSRSLRRRLYLCC